MGATRGISAGVTSWSGTANAQLITGSKPMSATLDVSGDEFDSTGFASSLVQASYTKGMRSWSGTIEGYRPVPGIGSVASITFSAGYTALVKSFDITLEADVMDASVFGSTATTNTFREYLAGLIRVSGSYEILVDDTTPVTLPGNSSEPATLTLTFASGDTIAVSSFTTALRTSLAVNALNSGSYSFRGTGNVTVASSGDDMPFDAGSSISTPAAGSLVLTAASGRTFTGDAFWRRVRMTCPVDGLITVGIDYQGTGVLTPA